MMIFLSLLGGVLFCLISLDLGLTARTIKDYSQADDINFLSAFSGVAGLALLVLSFI